MAGLSRRSVLSGAGALGMAGAGELIGRRSATAQSPYPVVSMEAVLLAAQWDPVKPDSAPSPGAQASVLLVEQALVHQGLLTSSLVDGHFGTATINAYAAWQRSLGYSGLGATGLPGRASLGVLGQGRFDISNVVNVGTRTTHQGYPVNQRTLNMLRAAERIWGKRFVLEQGSYSPGEDPTSKGTHDGGGALDMDAESLTNRARTAAVRALRQVGFAAWLRNPDQDNWPWHIHAIAISDTDLAPAAAKQVGNYFQGRNGLRSDAPDDGPPVRKVTYEEYLRGS